MPENRHPDGPTGSPSGGYRQDADDAPTDLLPVVGTQSAASDPTAARTPPAKSRRSWWIGLGAAAFVILAVLGVYLVDVFATRGEIERGTRIAGVDVGGMTPAQATEALERELGPKFRQPVTLTAHGAQVTLDPQDAGLTADITGAVAAAGTRSGSPIDRLSSFSRSVDVPLTVQVDRAVLTGWVQQVADRTDVAAVDGRVTRDGTRVVTVDPVVGRTLQVAPSVEAIAAAWRADGPQGLTDLALPTSTEKVRVSAAGVAAAKKEAQTILAGPLTVKTADGTLAIRQATLADAVTIAPDKKDGFTVTIDSAALRAGIEAKVEATQTAAKDADIGNDAGKPTITPGVVGRSVDWDATQTALAKALMSKNRVWTVAYTAKEPNFSTADAKALGLNEVIGEFTTGGFAYASGQNIKVTADKVQGALVMPGETFSLNGFTGPRTEAEGYIPAGVIQDGAISTAVGGGISQFATTLYNASYFAGMGDVSHQPHSFYISRYPMGREATVFDGQIDLAFSNDYDTAVMIQTAWTESDITVRIWGTKHVQVDSQTTDPFDYSAAPTKTIPYGQSCAASDGSSGLLGGEHPDHQGSVGQGTAPGEVHHRLQRSAARDLRTAATRPDHGALQLGARRCRHPCSAAERRSRQQHPATAAELTAFRSPCVRRDPDRYAGPAGLRHAAVAQLVAHPTCNRAVRGSSPLGGSTATSVCGIHLTGVDDVTSASGGYQRPG